MIILVVEVKTKPGKRDEYVKAAEDCVKHTRMEEGNRDYRLLLSTDDPDDAVFFEIWDSKEALDLHTKTEHYLKLRPKVEELCVSTAMKTYEISL